jgi:UDP-glucose 4-epimerase
VRILVTGGCGFIGSNLVRRCLDEGWKVDVVDDLSNGHLEFVPKGQRVHVEDFACDASLRRVEHGSYDTIFHIAAVPRVSYSVEHPFETQLVNSCRSVKLIAAARGNCNRVVFASSSSVYGGAEHLPTHESTPRNPKSPYALQKAHIEDYLQMFSDLYGLDSACLRFFNVFGPNQLGDTPYSTAVSAWLTAIMKGRPMRSDGDGTQSRDMCYVDNVVDACVKASLVPDRLRGRCYNVACGDRTTNNEILDHLMQRYPQATKVDAPWRPGDVMHTQADVSRARDELGYVPLVRFWEGLDRTIAWAEQTPEFLTLALKT